MDFYRSLKRFACLLLIVLAPLCAKAQDAPTFQNFFLEGSQQQSVYGDIGLVFSDYDFANFLLFGGQVGFPIGESFELGITLDILSIDPEFGGNRSGLADPLVIGRYQIQGGQTDISIGGGLTLPLGEEEVGGGDGVDLNLFGALRHYINQALAITGVLGIDFIEQADDYDASLRLGGAVIYRTTPDLQLIGELNILSDPEFALLTFGIDYQLSNSTRLRPAIGIGVDDGAPDFALTIRLLFQ